jgi:hypothetical protein
MLSFFMSKKQIVGHWLSIKFIDSISQSIYELIPLVCSVVHVKDNHQSIFLFVYGKQNKFTYPSQIGGFG